MAYLKKNLVHVGGGYSELPQLFFYVSDDTVTEAGYFPKDDVLKEGDIVRVLKITKETNITAYEAKEYYLKADAQGVLTATELAAAAA